MIIGEKIINEYGEIEYEKGKTLQGFVYKDYNAFKNRTDEVCYIPELADIKYTYRDILDECRGNERLAEEVFNVIDWQMPCSYVEDLINAGCVLEDDDNYYFNPDAGFNDEDWQPEEKYL